MKQLSTDEARQVLGQIKQAQHNVITQGPREYVPFIGWGIWVLFAYPPFDFVNDSVWGPIIFVVWVVGMALTFRYFRDKAARVHILSTTPWYIWVTLIVLTSLAVIFAELAHPTFSFAWTLSGILLAVPYITYGLVLKAKGK